MKTAIEIIQETVDFYIEDPSRRALVEHVSLTHPTCVFKTSEGKKCAVGRCADDDKLNELYNNTIGEPYMRHVLDILKPEYLGQEDQFWTDLQILHDTGKYWDEKGMTTYGITYVAKLLDRYKG